MYPVARSDERVIPLGYNGPVVTCDVDKTYLDTDFKTLRGLAQIPLEWAVDKRAVPGMVPLLQGIRHGPGRISRQTPFFFLTASPPLLFRVLRRKMLLDGVQCDGIAGKDWHRILVRRRRPSWLKRQVAFKLCALLDRRREMPPDAQEILIGDDVEADAFIYALYARFLEGELSASQLAAKAGAHGADEEERAEVKFAATQASVAPKRGVAHIYIYLAAQSPPSQIDAIHPRVRACRSPLQTACHLYAQDIIDERTVMTSAHEWSSSVPLRAHQAISQEVQEGIARGLLDPTHLPPPLLAE